MKQIYLEQGSPEWLSYRRNRIGASDCASILGVGFMTPNQLFLNKLGLYEPSVTTFMSRGQEMEPKARRRFQEMTGIEVAPAVVEHDSRPWQFASLDGISSDGKTLVEIKTGGDASLSRAKDGIIPEKYVWQVQHQLEVTGLEKCVYFFFDGENGYPIDIYRDENYIHRLIDAEKKFWDDLQNFDAPPLTDKDRVTRETAERARLAKEWIEISERMKADTKREKELRDLLITESEGQNSIGCGVSLTKIVRQGNIDYKAIPQLRDVELNEFRKDPTEYWRVSKT